MLWITSFSVTDLKVFGVLDRIFALGHLDLFGGPDLGQTATEYGILHHFQGLQ